jgi:hypothetical protein
MKTTVTSVILAGLLTSVGACVRHTEPLRSQGPMTPAERDFDNLWQASRYVLKKYHFTLDIQDRRTGMISTEPMLGKQFFEFWRHDSTTGRDTSESTLQSIYRTAFVTIAPKAMDQQSYKPTVVVTIDRSDMGRTSIVAISDVYRMQFGERVVRQGLDERKDRVRAKQIQEAMRTNQKERPVLAEGFKSLGRDEKLEKKIQDEIVDAATSRIYMQKLELPWPKALW